MTSYAKRQETRKQLEANKERERELKEEKEAERQVRLVHNISLKFKPIPNLIACFACLFSTLA